MHKEMTKYHKRILCIRYIIRCYLLLFKFSTNYMCKTTPRAIY